MLHHSFFFNRGVMTLNDWAELKNDIYARADRTMFNNLEALEEMSDELRWAMYGDSVAMY